MTTKKKLLIVGGLALLGFSLMAVDKAKNLAAIFEKMTIKAGSLPKNIKAGLKGINFNIDIKLTNPTGENFDVSGGYVASLKRVVVYYKGAYLGAANVEIDEISVPSHDVLILHDVPIVISTETVLQNLSTVLQQLNSLNINDLKFTGVIEALGVEYEIGK